VKRDREVELYWIRKKNLYEASRIVTFWLSPAVVTMATFGFFLMFEGNLTPERAFVVFSTILVIQVMEKHKCFWNNIIDAYQ